MSTDNSLAGAIDLPACMKLRVQNSTSIWHRDHTLLRSGFSILAAQFILMSLSYQMVRFLLRPLKQPKFVCSVLAGILIGPHVLGRVNDIKYKLYPSEVLLLARTVGAVGITFFIFLCAVKMEVGLIRRTAKKASIVGLSSILVTFATVLLLLKRNTANAGIKAGFFHYLFAAGLSVTRFPNVASAFDELKLLTSELGQLCMSLSMVSEMFTWMWLTIGISYRQHPERHDEIDFVWPEPSASVVAFLLFMAFVVRPAMKSIVRRIPEGRPVEGIFIIAILTGALVTAFIADMIGSIHMGVLALGLVIPDGPPLGAAIVERSELIVEEFFLPIFYVIVGVYTDITTIKFQDLKDSDELIRLVSAAFIAKFAGTTLSAMICGFKSEHALVLGLMTNIRGPFDLSLFIRWRRAQDIMHKNFRILVLSQVVITAIVTPLIEIFYDSRVRMGIPARVNSSALQTTPNNVEFRVISCIYDEESAPGLMSLLNASDPTATSPICAYILHLNELVGRAAPVIIPHSSKRVKRAWSKRSCRIWRAFNIFLSNSNGFIRIKAFTMIAPYSSMHENICKLAQDESIPLILVPFHGNPEININQAAAIHNLNKNIQAHAPCTVGILVDRGLRHFTCEHASFFFNVAVVFMGGADDREALSFGARMSSHQNVVISILRLIVSKFSDVEDMIEKKLDDALVDEFRRKSTDGGRSSYSEVVIEDVVQAVNEIRTLENKFNLIIVGKQRQPGQSLPEYEMMLQWSENPDLGVLGDMIASPDFKGSDNTSVLVMQHRGNIGGSIHQCSTENEAEYLLGEAKW